MKIFGFEKVAFSRRSNKGENCKHSTLRQILDEYAIEYSEDPETFRKKLKNYSQSFFHLEMNEQATKRR